MNLRWKKLAQQDIKLNRYRTMRKVRYQLPNGRVGDFYVNVVGPVVAALVLTRDQRVVLVEQYRPGPERVLLELPGGCVNPGESAVRAATREVLEETGYRGRVRRIATTTNSGWSDLSRSHFVITDAKNVASPTFDHYEYGRVRLVSLTTFRRLLRKGMMTDIETGYLGLDALGLL